MSDPHFRLDFSTAINSGKIVEHAASTILRHIGAVTQRYKIGVTHLPYTRFYKRYKNKDFCFLARLQHGRWGFKGWVILAIIMHGGSIGRIQDTIPQTYAPSYADQWKYMILIGITESIETAGMLESSLIREFNVIRKVFQ
jgi:hypothetical protein